MVEAPIQHISLDERGIAYITGTRIKVASIVVDALTWGLTPREIQENYPQLSLAQIHAALAYYYDHQTEIDTQLATWDAEYEQLRLAHPNPLSREEWEARRQAKKDGSSDP
jgi:uncharacterized protein (DUF433 family)